MDNIKEMKFLIYSLVVAAIVYVIATYVIKVKNGNCPKARIAYRPYIRTFIEEQEDPTYVTNIFKNMFHGTNPWSETKVQSSYLKVGRQDPLVHGGRAKNILVGENNSRDDYMVNFFG